MTAHNEAGPLGEPPRPAAAHFSKSVLENTRDSWSDDWVNALGSRGGRVEERRAAPAKAATLLPPRPITH